MTCDFVLRAIYSGGIDLRIKNISYREAIKVIVEKTDFFDYEPAEIVIPELRAILFFNKELFTAFIEDEISINELIEQTKIIGLFRNASDLEIDGETIDKGSLWKYPIGHQKNVVVLVDDDRYIEYPFSDDNFTLME